MPRKSRPSGPASQTWNPPWTPTPMPPRGFRSKAEMSADELAAILIRLQTRMAKGDSERATNLPFHDKRGHWET